MIFPNILNGNVATRLKVSINIIVFASDISVGVIELPNNKFTLKYNIIPNIAAIIPITQ